MIEHLVTCAAASGHCAAALHWRDEREYVDPDLMAGHGWDLVDQLWVCPRHHKSIEMRLFDASWNRLAGRSRH